MTLKAIGEIFQMKKIGLICATLLAGLSLSACGNSVSQSSNKASSSSSVKTVKHHKDKSKQNNKKQSSSSSSASSSSAGSQQSQNNQASQQTNNAARSNGQVASSQSSNNSGNGLPPASDLHDFVNRYGESPAAYLSDHNGMSPEQAVQSVPNDMKTSGEIQDTYQIQQGQDLFN